MKIRSLVTTVGLTLALSLGAITTSAIAAPSGQSASATVLDEYKKPPSFLFVVQAKEAVLKPVDDDLHRYTLSMKLTDENVGKIIAFTDRPYRIVKMISTKQLLDSWGEGKNSFKADPPNAVLSANGFDARIVILESMIINNEQLTYTLVQTDPSSAPLKGGQLKDVVVTIDGGNCASDGTNYAIQTCYSGIGGI